MAKSMICDVCGTPAIGNVQVSIHSENVMVQGEPTGTSLAKDLCATCRKTSVAALFAECCALHEAAIIAA